MTPQELKNSLLQLAIQGKLVEQRPEEGTGEELYRQIQAEKQKLIREGKIKKEKPLPEIAEDEVPFDIPESWKWVRVGNITTLNPKNEANDETEAAFIPMTLVADGYRNQHSYEIKKWGEIKKGFTHFTNGDIGIAKITPCFQNRKSVIFDSLVHNLGAGTTELSIVRVIADTVNRKYLLWLFKSDYFVRNGIKSFTGTAGQQRIHKEYLANCVIPLPSLAEQKRIVAKIEELLPLIDRYEKAWSRLEEFNRRFPADMQKSLLQMAIQGKLVEQRPEEGTGEELYRQIQAEKQRLIKEGKIKKEKPLPEITEDEKPFDIPENWEWARLGDLARLITKGSSPRWQGIQYTEHGLLFVTSENVGAYSLLWKTKKYVDNRFNKLSPRSKLMKGDLLTNIVGASIGRTAVYDLDEPANINQAVCIVRLINMGLLHYILLYMNSTTAYNIMMSDKVDTARANISLTNVSNFLVPLPPLAEQKRIVAKLEDLLPLCERLK